MWHACTKHVASVVQVRLTGHSLGGALATLAALECAQALHAMEANAHIACYTFGAPRTGNHAFAKEYERYVFDSWSIINDQACRTLRRLAIALGPAVAEINQALLHHIANTA